MTARASTRYMLNKKAIQHYLIDHDLTQGDFAKTLGAGSVGVEVAGKFSHEVENEMYAALADLIDRPTCHLVEDEDGRTACSECGCTALCLPDATYCPDCGSIIERPR